MLQLSTPVRAAILVGCVALFAGVAVAGPGAASAVVPAFGQTVMTSVDASTPAAEGDGPSSDSSVSADGRFVAFTSYSSNLVSVGTHGTSQVYERDLSTGVTTLVSVGAVPTESGDAASVEPAISADGRYVAFSSSAANLTLPADAEVFQQVYVRDTVAGTTRKISLRADGLGGGDEGSNSPSISADGSLIAYQSVADDLMKGITPTESQVYIGRNAADPKTRLGSARNGTAQDLADSGSSEPSISGDGSTVVFASIATNLTSTTSNKNAQVYSRDIVHNITQRLSVDLTDPDLPGNSLSRNPVVSFDGSRVAYESSAKNVVAPSINFRQQIFVYDRATAQNLLVSYSAANVSGTTGQVMRPTISADGNRVAYSATSGDLTSTPDNGFEQIYLRTIDEATTEMVSLRTGAPASGGTRDSVDPALSPDGNYITFTSFSTEMSATVATRDRPQTYLRAIGAVAPTPTPTPTSTGGTVPPTGSPSSTDTATTAAGQDGIGPAGGQLASTGMSQAPIIVGGVSAAVLALVGGSILFGSRSVRRRRLAASTSGSSAVAPSAPAGGSQTYRSDAHGPDAGGADAGGADAGGLDAGGPDWAGPGTHRPAS